MRKVKPKTDDYMLGGSGPMKAKKSEPRYPTIRLELDTIPEAKDWKVGEEYEVDLKLKMVGISQARYDNSAEFEIREIGIEEPEKDDEGEGDKGDEE